jgi:hypothetical protein
MIPDYELYSRPETWVPWRVNWSGIWPGALTALVMSLIFGLLGTVIGATSLQKFSSWHTISRVDVAAAILTAFFAFAIGGWVAGRITGARHSETTILHAVIAWLVAIPLLFVAIAAGAGNAFGGWYGGLVASPIGAAVAQPPTPDVVRGTAMSALCAILVALAGSVIGGWMASGEPMTLTHHSKRNAYLRSQKGNV